MDIPKKCCPDKVPSPAPAEVTGKLPEYVEKRSELLAVTRQHSTCQGCSAQLDRKRSGGFRKIFLCANVLTINKLKTKHIQDTHQKCAYKVVWRYQMHKSLGKKVWKLDKLESNFKHSPMCSSGTVLHAMPHTLPHGMPHTLPHGMPHTLPHGMPHAMSHSMFWRHVIIFGHIIIMCRTLCLMHTKP